MQKDDVFVLGTVPAGTTLVQVEDAVEARHPDGTLERFRFDQTGYNLKVIKETATIAPDFKITVKVAEHSLR